MSRSRLHSAVTKRVELLGNGRPAVVTLSATMAAVFDAQLADTGDLSNKLLRIGSLVVSVMLVEQPRGNVRIDFRSESPLSETRPDIDVAAPTASFGGGRRPASGARLPGTLDSAVAATVHAVEPQPSS